MMIPDNKEIYVYGSCLGQQQYLPQFDLSGGMFTHITHNGRTRDNLYVATTPTSASSQNAWHLPRYFNEPWQDDNIYQTMAMGSQSTTVVTPQRQASYIPPTPLFPYSDNSDSQETIQIQPSCSTVVLNGTKYYHCVCGHLALRKGDMSRHHESSKHAFRQHFCTICGLGFTRKDGLKRHKKKKHPWQHKTTGSVTQAS